MGLRGPLGVRRRDLDVERVAGGASWPAQQWCHWVLIFVLGRPRWQPTPNPARIPSEELLYDHLTSLLQVVSFALPERSPLTVEKVEPD